MILTTIENVPGYQIKEHYGMVTGSTVQTKHAFADLFAFVRNLIGGELPGYTELLKLAREESTNRMILQAKEHGANAIINIRLSTSSIASGAAEIFIYGTAVKVEKK